MLGTDAAPTHVVIVGAGFGGLSAAKALAHLPVRVTVIDRNTHHLFQPLLYQAATAALSATDIAEPIRSILRRQTNATVLLGEVIGIDKNRREVILPDQRLHYDYLIIATGTRHSYFGHDDWERYAPGLKTIEDATLIRNRILMAFETVEKFPEKCESLLTFVIVGGGPTGVEMAGSIGELARQGLCCEFRHFNPNASRIILVQSSDRILPSFPAGLADKALNDLRNLGVEVRLNTKVTRIDDAGVELSTGESIASHNVIWAAGVAASPAGKWLETPTDRTGRVRVLTNLSLPGWPEIFVIGDTAYIDKMDLPGIAPVAKQQGKYVGAYLRAKLEDKTEPRPFRYRDQGQLATIGRASAIADFGKIRLNGFIGWLIWLIVHIYFLIGFENRLSVMMQWGWSYLTYRRGNRLVTRESVPAYVDPHAGSPSQPAPASEKNQHG